MKHAPSANPIVNEFIDALDDGIRDHFIAVREVVLSAAPSLAEDIKWKNCLTYVLGKKNLIQTVVGKDKISLIFHNGASLQDPDGILEGDGTRTRTVRLARGSVSRKALQGAVRRAVAAAS